ncbi:MAG: inositol 2-dehydrogenase [Trueperaceae bacterium]|nr:inositol 2-dehydrogenase [Trueperaceae bacterium]
MLNVALFGAGRIGKVHAASVAKNSDAQLLAVVDVHEPSARALAEQYGARVSSQEAVFSDASIDAILICSATNTHADLIEAGARSGKVIFCEKPIDLSLERVKSCLAVVKEHKAKLFVGFNRRFDKNFRALKNALTNGEIGKAELLQISSRDPGPPPLDYIKVSGGLFRDMMIHDLDMACWLMGETPVAVSASASSVVDKKIGEAGDVDTAIVTLEFASGALAVITNSRRASYGYDQRIEVHGEKGMLQAENVLESTLIKSTGDGVVSQKPMYFFLERYEGAYASELESFIQLANGKAEAEVSGEDGERALALADAALRALESGQKQRL